MEYWALEVNDLGVAETLRIWRLLKIEPGVRVIRGGDTSALRIIYTLPLVRALKPLMIAKSSLLG